MFLILKNLFKIKVHLFFYIFMFVSFITGHFWDYIILTSIIIVHEFGHIFGGFIFSWKIDKIIVLPIGGLTIFNTLINTSLFEQFVVAILGPLFQVVYFLILNYFFHLSHGVMFYNFSLLFFNLLPIYPLDGSKIFYVILNLLFPFKFSYLLLLFVSFIFIFVCFYFSRFNLMLYLILFFLIVKCVNEFLNFKNIFNRFLLERYLYDLKFKHVRYVSSINKMYLWCRHIFGFEKTITERDFLFKMFDK